MPSFPFHKSRNYNSERLTHLTKDTQPASRGARCLSRRAMPPQEGARAWSSPAATAAEPALLFLGASAGHLLTLEPGWHPPHPGKGLPLPALPRQSTLSPSGDGGSPSQGPKLPCFSWPLTVPLSSSHFPGYWWLLRVLPFPSQNHGLKFPET